MSGWARAFWMAVVLIVPGGFVLFLAYAFSRALLAKRREIAQANRTDAHWREVLANTHFQDVLREVRASIRSEAPSRLLKREPLPLR
ncbi:MAG TPA: hypothetical protein VEM39_09025 [Myxococcaceae bacterium]|nr:hypothetical protein [Myxococcaceae bacterium]